jgi:uncharacterized membrane protein YcfT
MLKGLVDWTAKRKGEVVEDAELGKGSLFATGLVAGGALFGVIVALLSVPDGLRKSLANVNMEESMTHSMGSGMYNFIGLLFFIAMGVILFRVARKK